MPVVLRASLHERRGAEFSGFPSEVSVTLDTVVLSVPALPRAFSWDGSLRSG